MAKTLIDIDDDALRLAAEALGTKTKKDTVNAALAEVAARLRREQAWAELIEMAEDGVFDKGLEPGFKEEMRGGWAAHRKAS
jgi:hypothetical protein